MSLLGGLQARHDLQELQRLRDTTSACETRCEELESTLGDARFDLQKALSRCDQLEVQLGDALEELRARPTLSVAPGEGEGGNGGVGGTSSPKGEEKTGEDKSALSTEEVSGRPVFVLRVGRWGDGGRPVHVQCSWCCSLKYEYPKQNFDQGDEIVK